MKKHTIEILVIDEPGVMSRITGMFARRGFNIDTITVGKTQKQGTSKIVFTCIADDKGIRQVEKQCDKLIDVLEVKEFIEDESVQREMCLVKINAKSDEDKGKIQNFAKDHKFEVVDTSNSHVIIEMMASSEKIDDFLKEMEPFGIIDISRTGITSISK